MNRTHLSLCASLCAACASVHSPAVTTSAPVATAPDAAVAPPPSPPAAPPPPRPHLVAVQHRTVRSVVRAPATLTPSVTASVVAHRAGVVLVLMADNNAQVHRGDVLATVGPANNAPGRRRSVRAPIDGVVLERRANLGDPVEADRTVLFALGNLGNLQGHADVEERHALSIRAGQPLRFVVDAMPGREFQSAVQRVGVTMTASHTMPMEFPVANPDLGLRPGMSGVAVVETSVHENALVIPSAAIVVIDDQPQVFTVVDGRAHLRPVRFGLVDGDVTEVEGLYEGEQVLTPGSAVHEGDAVRAGD